MNSRTQFRFRDLTFLRPGGCSAELSATGACDAERAESRTSQPRFMPRTTQITIFCSESRQRSCALHLHRNANPREESRWCDWINMVRGCPSNLGNWKNIRDRAVIAFGSRKIWRIASEGLRNQRVREGAQFRHGVRYSNSMVGAYARSNMANGRSRQSRRPERQLL